MSFERLGSRSLHDGFVRLERERWRYPDGSEHELEVVRRADSACVVPCDGTSVYLVRQPRPAVGEPGLLELPAGGVDPGEEPLAAARRELAEELGLGAGSWRPLGFVYSSPGALTEAIWLYAATDLHPAEGSPDEDERIEIVRWPLERLGELHAELRDAKSLLGLMLFERERARGLPKR